MSWPCDSRRRRTVERRPPSTSSAASKLKVKPLLKARGALAPVRTGDRGTGRTGETRRRAKM